LKEYEGIVEQSKLQALIGLSQVRGSVEHVAATAPDVKGLEGWEKVARLMESLAARKVGNVSVNLGIVRGLDYYSGVVFEVFASGEGGGGALVGGGRYDRLTDAFGRKDIGATGAAGGVERIVMALQKQGVPMPPPAPLVYVAYAEDGGRQKALELAATLRSGGIATDYDILGRALRKQLDDAATKGAQLVVIVAPSETAEGKVTVKSMKDGSESRHALDGIADTVAGLLRS
jgi:histidyl-tRNA synthetase